MKKLISIILTITLLFSVATSAGSFAASEPSTTKVISKTNNTSNTSKTKFFTIFAGVAAAAVATAVGVYEIVKRYIPKEIEEKIKEGSVILWHPNMLTKPKEVFCKYTPRKKPVQGVKIISSTKGQTLPPVCSIENSNASITNFTPGIFKNDCFNIIEKKETPVSSAIVPGNGVYICNERTYIGNFLQFAVVSKNDNPINEKSKETNKIITLDPLTNTTLYVNNVGDVFVNCDGKTTQSDASYRSYYESPIGPESKPTTYANSTFGIENVKLLQSKKELNPNNENPGEGKLSDALTNATAFVEAVKNNSDFRETVRKIIRKPLVWFAAGVLGLGGIGKKLLGKSSSNNEDQTSVSGDDTTEISSGDLTLNDCEIDENGKFTSSKFRKDDPDTTGLFATVPGNGCAAQGVLLFSSDPNNALGVRTLLETQTPEDTKKSLEELYDKVVKADGEVDSLPLEDWINTFEMIARLFSQSEERRVPQDLIEKYKEIWKTLRSLDAEKVRQGLGKTRRKRVLEEKKVEEIEEEEVVVEEEENFPKSGDRSLMGSSQSSSSPAAQVPLINNEDTLDSALSAQIPQGDSTELRVIRAAHRARVAILKAKAAEARVKDLVDRLNLLAGNFNAGVSVSAQEFKDLKQTANQRRATQEEKREKRDKKERERQAILISRERKNDNRGTDSPISQEVGEQGKGQGSTRRKKKELKEELEKSRLAAQVRQSTQQNVDEAREKLLAEQEQQRKQKETAAALLGFSLSPTNSDSSGSVPDFVMEEYESLPLEVNAFCELFAHDFEDEQLRELVDKLRKSFNLDGKGLNQDIVSDLNKDWEKIQILFLIKKLKEKKALLDEDERSLVESMDTNLDGVLGNLFWRYNKAVLNIAGKIEIAKKLGVSMDDFKEELRLLRIRKIIPLEIIERYNFSAALDKAIEDKQHMNAEEFQTKTEKEIEAAIKARCQATSQPNAEVQTPPLSEEDKKVQAQRTEERKILNEEEEHFNNLRENAESRDAGKYAGK